MHRFIRTLPMKLAILILINNNNHIDEDTNKNKIYENGTWNIIKHFNIHIMYKSAVNYVIGKRQWKINEMKSNKIDKRGKYFVVSIILNIEWNTIDRVSYVALRHWNIIRCQHLMPTTADIIFWLVYITVLNTCFKFNLHIWLRCSS